MGGAMSSVILAGDTSGSVTLAAPAVAGSSVLTMPVATDTLVGKATTDTLTNKTLAVTGNTFNFTPITASLGANVAMNNTANYFDGPSVAQGTSGTWFASGTIGVQDTTVGNNVIQVKLWDGTTVIASCFAVLSGATSSAAAISLSGFISAPAGNIRISAKDVTTTAGLILFNGTGNSKDSTITAIRIA